jgi:Class II flagellar assembly regulator
MDIKKIINGTSAVTELNQKRKSESGQLDFQKVLKDAKSNTSVAGQSAPSASRGVEEIPADPAYAIQALSGPEQINQIRSQGVERAENTLTILEQYQKAMGDPQTSLKNVNGLIQSLSQEVNGLHRLSEKLPSSDPLQKIMNEIGIVSAVEIEKFNRGEYI